MTAPIPSVTRMVDMVSEGTIHDLAAPVLATVAAASSWLAFGTYAAFGAILAYRLGRMAWKARATKRFRARERDDLDSLVRAVEHGGQLEAEAARADAGLAPISNPALDALRRNVKRCGDAHGYVTEQRAK